MTLTGKVIFFSLALIVISFHLFMDLTRTWSDLTDMKNNLYITLTDEVRVFNFALIVRTFSVFMHLAHIYTLR